jgi:diadenosine tetraphosphate (Ap4A) HIT family hydrolase
MFKSWLFSPFRKKWVKSKGNDETCVFCEIAKGNPNVPSKAVWKDAKLMVLMNIYPYNTGHLQVVPVRHVENLEELTEGEYQKLWKVVKKCVVLLKEVLQPKGFNVGINLGEVAGASIRHLHVHIVPRFERDFGFMEVVAQTKVIPVDMDELHKQLKEKAKEIFEKD